MKFNLVLAGISFTFSSCGLLLLFLVIHHWPTYDGYLGTDRRNFMIVGFLLSWCGVWTYVGLKCIEPYIWKFNVPESILVALFYNVVPAIVMMLGLFLLVLVCQIFRML